MGITMRIAEEIINNIIPVDFSLEEYTLISKNAELVKYKKGTMPVITGDSLASLYIIISGLVRGLYIDEDGYEVTKCFSCEREFFATEGLTNTDIATFSIECLEDVHALRIPYTIIGELKESNREFKSVFNEIIIKEYVKSEKKTRNLLMCDATARYQIFLKDYAHLKGRLKQKYIASYLGISPISLSRLKNI